MIHNENNRFCIIQGHQDNKVTHICTFVDCQQITRLCCLQCIKKGVHNHDQSDSNHLMNRKQIRSKVLILYENLRKDFDLHNLSQAIIQKRIIKECQLIEDSLIDYGNKYKILSHNTISNFEQCLSYIKEDNFQFMDDDMINQILSINNHQFDQYISTQDLQQFLDNTQQQLQEIQIIIKEHKDNFIKNNNIFNNVDLRKRNYAIQQIDEYEFNSGSSISKNEKYLAYGSKQLNIFDLKLKIRVKKIQLDYELRVLQFSQDSSKLYVGLYGPYVYGYDAQNDFNVIYRLKIQSTQILNIIAINNKYLVIASDNLIYKTDVKSKKQIFKLTGHDDWIYAIDYNYKDDMIVSGSDDKSLKLWDCRNQSLIINKEEAHNKAIKQIQSINNHLNILSLDSHGNLYKWKIDLTNKHLIKLQQFSDSNQILNFQQVNQDQNLLLICENYIKILTQQGTVTNKIYHGYQQKLFSYDCRQLDNMNYIQIIYDRKIMLLTAQD